MIFDVFGCLQFHTQTTQQPQRNNVMWRFVCVIACTLCVYTCIISNIKCGVLALALAYEPMRRYSFIFHEWFALMKAETALLFN